MKTSFRDILEFDRAAAGYKAKHEGKFNKLCYALDRVLSQVKIINASFQEKLSDIDVEFCAEDEKGIVLKDKDGGYEFKKEDLKKRNKARSEAFIKPEIEINPHFVTKIPDDLTDEQIRSFSGFVIQNADEILAEREASAEGDGAITALGQDTTESLELMSASN